MSTKRYDQLISDLRGDYRPQREWGEGKGVLMVVGHFLVGIAGGTWLLASIYEQPIGLIIAWLLGALGGGVHLLFLGRPERVLKMIRHFRTSWISRGFLGLTLFLVGGALVIALPFVAPEQTVLLMFGRVVAAIGTVTIIGYMGFCYTASKAIPFWHSPLHPAVYIAYAVRGGIAALLVVAAFGVGPLAPWLLQLWMAVTAVVALFFVLEIQSALTSGNIAAKWSARDILAGRLAKLFYGGTLVLGLVVPLLLLTATATLSPFIMAMIGLASAAGDFFMKLSTVRAGVYLPLMLPSRR